MNINKERGKLKELLQSQGLYTPASAETLDAYLELKDLRIKAKKEIDRAGLFDAQGNPNKAYVTYVEICKEARQMLKALLTPPQGTKPKGDAYDKLMESLNNM